jgi:hypothetical protein
VNPTGARQSAAHGGYCYNLFSEHCLQKCARFDGLTAWIPLACSGRFVSDGIQGEWVIVGFRNT